MCPMCSTSNLISQLVYYVPNLHSVSGSLWENRISKCGSNGNHRIGKIDENEQKKGCENDKLLFMLTALQF